MRQPRSNDFIAIDINITKDTERAQIIYATNMVVMDMRNQDAIYLPERHTQQLLSDIRSGIYQNTGILRFYHCCTTQSLSCGSVLRHTSQLHPNEGTPPDVPVPNNITLNIEI